MATFSPVTPIDGNLSQTPSNPTSPVGGRKWTLLNLPCDLCSWGAEKIVALFKSIGNGISWVYNNVCCFWRTRNPVIIATGGSTPQAHPTARGAALEMNWTEAPLATKQAIWKACLAVATAKGIDAPTDSEDEIRAFVEAFKEGVRLELRLEVAEVAGEDKTDSSANSLETTPQPKKSFFNRMITAFSRKNKQ